MIYTCISTHHLLPHKPDNLLQTGHKYHCTGYYKFGTPGIALCWATDRIHVENFMAALRSAMPQKKFQYVFDRIWQGDMPQGWNLVETAADLKKAMGEVGGEGVSNEDYFLILGLDPPQSSSSSSSCVEKNETTKKMASANKKKKK